MASFLPSTQQLFQVLGFACAAPGDAGQARDVYPIHAALVAWQNALYGQLSEQAYKEGTWPASDELLDALRAALADQRGNDAGDELAYALVRCGCRRPETIASLCAWDAQLFRWRAAGWRAQDLFAKFQAAGAAGHPTDADLEKVNGWLADPAAALGQYYCGSLAGTLLKGRIFVGSLYHHGGWPDYAGLFDDMARHAGLPVSRVSQQPLEQGLEDVTARTQAELGASIPDAFKDIPIYREPDTFWKIAYELDGTAQAVYVPGGFSRVNDAGLALQFDAILARLGRAERVLRFAPGRADGSDWALYIIAQPQRFAALCSELGIPLAGFTGSQRA